MSHVREGKEYQMEKPRCSDCGRVAVDMLDARCWDCACAYYRKRHAEHAETLIDLRKRRDG